MKRRRQHNGFTLIELMVVASVIVCLLVVTVPALKSMINSGQQAQAANIIRSMLLVVRDYALTNNVPAGVRFQNDGRIVPIYAKNSGQHDAANYRTSGGGGALPGQAVNPFQMYAIPGMAPGMMPGSYRVIALDYAYTGGGTSNADFFTGQQWFLTAVILFSPRGSTLQAKAQFPTGWAPASTGSSGTPYDRWLATTTTYAFQGYTSTMTGPSVTTGFRIYDYGAAQAYLSQAAWPPNEAVTEAYRAIEQTGSDFIVTSSTGRMIRQGGDLADEQ